jgi:hypothetical protein
LNQSGALHVARQLFTVAAKLPKLVEWLKTSGRSHSSMYSRPRRDECPAGGREYIELCEQRDAGRAPIGVLDAE